MRGLHLAVIVSVGFWCAASPGDVTIRGRVTDASGAAVRGARAFWLRPAPINSYPESIDGTANNEGNFELKLVGHESLLDVQREAVLIYCEGYGLGTTTVGELSQAAQQVVSVVLPEESRTAFRVLGPDGRELEGVRVEPVIYRDGLAGKLPLSFVELVGRFTRRGGIVEFPAFHPNKLASVRVLSDAYGTQILGQRFGDEPLDQTIWLRAAGRVELRFDNAEGLSMRKCKVLAFTTEPEPLAKFPGRRTGPLQGTFQEFFDDNRGFDIPAIAEGTLRFQLSGCGNDESVLPHWPEKTELKPGDTKRFVVPFEKTVTISGQVLHSVTEKPVPNAEIYVYTRYAGCSFIFHADEEGRYHCNVLTGPACVQATRRDPITRVSSGSSSMVERVIGADGLEFPDLLVNPRTP